MLMMQELPTSSQAYSILLQEEKHLEISTSNNEENDSLACKVEKKNFRKGESLTMRVTEARKLSFIVTFVK